MVSAVEAGVVQFMAQSPDGQQFKLFEARTNVINAGGSPDGALANKTVDKWFFFAKNNELIMTGGWKIIPMFTPDAADGVDVSDCQAAIPISIEFGGTKYLNTTDLGMTADVTLTASVMQALGTGYTIPDGQRVKFGGGAGYFTVEDDTA